MRVKFQSLYKFLFHPNPFISLRHAFKYLTQGRKISVFNTLERIREGIITSLGTLHHNHRHSIKPPSINNNHETPIRGCRIMSHIKELICDRGLRLMWSRKHLICVLTQGQRV